MNSYQRRGAGAAAIVIGLVAVLIVGGAIWYFVSDPFKSKVDKQWSEATQWTKERIAQDPLGYLDWCEQKAKKALEKFDQQKKVLAITKAEWNAKRERSDERVKNGKAAIKALGELYANAESSNAFPVKYGGKSYSKDEARAAVVSWGKQVTGEEKLLEQIIKGLTTLENQGTALAKAETDTRTQLAQIDTNRGMVKISQMNKELTDQLANVQGVLDATVAIADTSSPAIPTLDQLGTQAPSGASDADFEKALKLGN